MAPPSGPEESHQKVEFSRTELTDTDEIIYKVRNLPAFNELKEKVDCIVDRSTWYEKHGVDWLITITALAMLVGGLAATASSTPAQAFLGWIIYGLGHTVVTAKTGHIASHGSLTDSPSYTGLWTWFFVEFIGGFSWQAAYEIHIKSHHPHTNIIGMGDSSLWKIPQLPRSLYMFLAPILLPVMAPLVSLTSVGPRPLVLLRYFFWTGLGWSFLLVPLTHLCGYTWKTAVVYIFLARAIMSVPYIHINIFQHIGLSMYSPKQRPARLFQMVTGVLNLDRNPLLEFAFGHSLVSAHVEHHLFPRLSDNMCLKVQPVVREFLTRYGLPYQRDSYSGRLKHFLANYDTLMVNAPPITHFVGLQ